jgi:CspA family cold shock protein
MNGRVKFYNENKGFGFITGEDGKEYFFHISGLADQNQGPEDNDEVVFDTEEGDRGLKAVNVKAA